MNMGFFTSQINRLSKLFGEKSYSGERLEIFWEHFRDLDAESFQKIIDRAVANSRYAPMLDDLLKFGAGEIELLNQTKRARLDEKLAQIKCSMCNGSGMISKKDQRGFNYAFLCGNCSSASIRGLSKHLIEIWANQSGYA